MATNDLFSPRTDIGGARGELGGVVGTVNNALYDRWWRKELDEFDRVVIPKMQEAVTKLGELAADENFTDHAGAWSMMKSAVAEVQNEALKYPNNPYISTKSANMHKNLSGSFQELTQGFKDIQSIRTSKEQQQLATAKREQLLPEQVATAQAQRKEAELGAEEARTKKSRMTSFGALRGNPAGWPSIIKATKEYAVLAEQRRVQGGAEAWRGEEGQRVRDDMGVMASEKDFLSNYALSVEDQDDLDREVFTSAVAQLDIDPDVAPSVLNDMVRSSPARENAGNALKPIDPPIAFQPGTAGMNKILWDDPDMGPGRAADLRPIIQRKHYGSIAGQTLEMYARLRLDGLNHEEAKEQVFSSGSIQSSISLRINTSTRNGQLSVAGIMEELDDMLEEESDNFLTSREEERQQRILEEGTYGGALQKVEEMYGEMANLPELAGRIWEAGKESLFGRELDPAAQEYLRSIQKKGAKAAPGAPPSAAPPRLIERE